MGFNPSEVTLFGVVTYDPSTDTHTLVGVQTKEVSIICDQAPVSPIPGETVWGVTTSPIAADLFQAQWNDPVGDQNGSIALNMPQEPDGTPIPVDGALFVDAASVVVEIQVPNTTGDGTLPEVHNLTVHLRALPGLELLEVPGGTALLGTGSSAKALVASGNPASTPFAPFIPAWTAIEWSAAGATATTPGVSTTITGAAGPFDLTLSTAAPAPSPDGVGATFDGATEFTLPGSGGLTIPPIEVNTGATQFEIVTDTTAPAIHFTGLPTEVGVDPAAAEAIDFAVEVDDGSGYFSLDAVLFTLEWTERHTLATSSVTWSYVPGTGFTLTAGAVPAGANVTMPQPVVSDAERPTVDSTRWGAGYPDAAHSARRATWGDGTTAGNVQVGFADGRFEMLRVTVEATDQAGNVHTEMRTVAVSIPTDLVLCLDYSGSMSSPPTGGGPAGPTEESKWDAARSAANRLHAVYHAMAPGIGGATNLIGKVGYVRFWWQGSDATGADQTSAVVALTDLDAGPAAGALVADADPPWAQYTPIAAGVQAGVAELIGPTNKGWRRRVVIAMTDGHENRGPDIADIRTTVAADPNFIENLGDNPEEGIIIHSCSFGQDSGVDADKMDWLANGADGGKSFDGQFHTTATAETPDAARALTHIFLNILVDSVPSVERLPSADAATESILVEPGVSRVVFLITTDDAATLSGPSAGSAVESSAAGVRWWAIDSPGTGDYSVSVSTAPATDEVDLHGVVDLQLRAKFSVEGPGAVGSELTLRTCITDAGRPVSGALVYARATTPPGSDGQLVTRFAKVQAVGKKRRRAIRGASLGLDAFSRRLALVTAAKKHFGIVERLRRRPDTRIRLREVHDAPGCYEAPFAETAVEGSYGFEFTAGGDMLEGGRFERAYGVSRYLSPVAEAAATPITRTLLRRIGELWRWKVTLTPTTKTGYAIGGGKRLALALDGHEEPVALTDHLDGSYSAIVETRERTLPKVELLDGLWRVPLEVAPSPGPRHVRVVLSHLEVDDLREELCEETGELSFDVVVAPDRSRSRAVRTRFPRKGALKLEKGVRLEVETEVFDGYVDEGSSLLVVVGGREHDWDGDDPLRTYSRVFRGEVASWAGSHGPGDEKPDPESLGEWKLWYRVEVL